ncbi:MAG: hypothetical protein P8184_12365 [Calditrichia bacterium]
MGLERYYFDQRKNLSFEESPNYAQRHFWWPLKRKRTRIPNLRRGAMTPDKVRSKISEIGIGNRIEITRVGYDGTVDDIPVIVEIIDITDSDFTGRIINVERKMIESATEKLVYAKKGGGIIVFKYSDGDIKDITVSKDEELLVQERNLDELREILTALDVKDRVIVAFYDEKQKGTLNTEGILLEKTTDQNNFTIQIEKVNRIELEKKMTKTFDIEKDLVIAIEMV